MSTINCKGTLIDLSTPKVMGILNVTPDSFYDGGKLKSDKEILQKIEKMQVDGATFIDIGGYSSKPGASFVSEEEEKNRVVPIIEMVLKQNPEVLFSVDTFRSEVANEALHSGAVLINDISAGLQDEKMFDVVAKHQVPYVMMHMRGTAQTMQKLTSYENLVKEINIYFSERIAKARSFGIHDIILDPGFGFAKTLEQNFELLNNLELLQLHDLPILAGISRKSMIYKTLDTQPDFALNGTTFLHGFCLEKGASILRVHDVKEAVQCITLFEQLKK
jgi:dihydropteroate synthase